MNKRDQEIPRRNLALIGGRGCGKSALSRRILRANKHFTLFPLDALVRYEAGGKTIPEIVEERGWSGFRELEFEVVRKVGAFPGGALIDCGGGIVVDLDADGNEIYSERKVASLQEHGLLVYLQRDVDYLIAQIGDDPNRPSLSDNASFREIMQRRDPWYRQAADITIQCGTRSKRALTEEILFQFVDVCRGSP
jgi:shikimate kinase